MAIILGIHGGVSINQHDAAAALIIDGKLVACVEEERLMRIKSPRGLLPIKSIDACLKHAGIGMGDVDLVAHPGETYEDAPDRIASYLTHYFGHAPKVRLINHQLAHMASAFFHSGYKDAVCLSYDAYGDRLSAAMGPASSRDGVKIADTRGSDNSLGIFYATMTSFLGFLPAEDEYKVMGLAALGKPRYDLGPFCRPAPDGYKVDMSFLRSDPPISSNWEPFYSQKLIDIVGEPRRMNEPLTQRHADIAYATQKTLEACAVSLITNLHEQTGGRNLCLAGGIALNCSANLVIRKLPFIDNLFIQPAASDRGLALGCAMQAAFEQGDRVEPPPHVYCGPERTEDQILEALALAGLDYEEVDPAVRGAELLADGCIIGWFQGRSEFGPRALGNRSILADPRPASMKDEINARVKFREEFRPFAPAVLADRASSIFDMTDPSPYMTMAFDVREEWRPRLGATTHLNGTGRVQTVHADTNPHFHGLIGEFAKRTDTPVLLNTSFNIKGQPIVETPLNAISTFASTGMDALIMGPFLVRKPRKPRGKPVPHGLQG